MAKVKSDGYIQGFDFNQYAYFAPITWATVDPV